MLSASRLRKVYRTTQVETVAIDDLDLEVEAGDFVALMGPSGSGKSTLLNLLGLLDVPSGGHLTFRGQEVTYLPERKRARLRRGNIGYIFQSFNLIDGITVAQNVELPLLYLKVPRAERGPRVLQALELAAVAHRRNHYPHQLSGGQQQRAAVARAIVGDPALVLADEPTGNLDSRNGKGIMNLLAQLNRAGMTIAMATHSPIDAGFSNRIIHLYDGKIVSRDLAAIGDTPTAPAAAVSGA